MTQKSKLPLLFIFVTILVDVIGIGIIIPVVPNLIDTLVGKGLSVAAGYGGALMMCYSIMQFIFAPILGELSDKFGRRPILLISLLGLGIDYIFHAFAPTIFWLFIGRILAGISGASFTVASAYIADVSTPENKAKNFGLIGAAFGLGFIIGPVIGGFCAEWGVQAPFFVAAGLTLANFIFGFFFVPESLSPENRREPILKKMIPGVSLIHLGSYKTLTGFIIAFFLASIAGQALPATWTYFTMESFQWTEKEVGYSLGVVGLLVAIVQAGLIGWSVKKFGNKAVIIFGFIFLSIGMFLFSIAHNEWLLYAFMLPYMLGGVATPTLQSLISNQISDKEQGNLQGALTSLVSISSIIGPPLSTGLFYYFTSSNAPVYFTGSPYFMSGILLTIATFIVIAALKNFERN